MYVIKGEVLRYLIVISNYFENEAYYMLSVETGISNFQHFIGICNKIATFLHKHKLIWLNDDWEWKLKPRDIEITEDERDWLNELRELYLIMKNDK